MWQSYIHVENLDQAIQVLHKEGENCKIIAGGTDLMLELERGLRQNCRILVDISRVPGVDKIELDERGSIHLGPLVTHGHCISSKLIRESALPLAQASWEVGSPQIRNRGTIAGNIITGSPANDTITPLIAMNAKVKLRSRNQERIVPLDQFCLGVRKTIMRSDEILEDIFFPALQPCQRGIYLKFALRQAQAISVVNLAIILTFSEEKIITQAAITMGAVAPTIRHALRTEEYLIGKELDAVIIGQAASRVRQDALPIDDIRGSAKFRLKILEVLCQRGLNAIASNSSGIPLPNNPVLLRSKPRTEFQPMYKEQNDATMIHTLVNGKNLTFRSGQGKSLLRMLREDGFLIGSKEGCAEGECGACTVFLDGQAVMSCIVPAPRADGAEIVTIEGIASGDQLHPVQKAFMEAGAVQCGYCTPGLIMSSVKLLDEFPHPTRNQIHEAISGNLCRCTGYYKILEAVEKAAKELGNGTL